MVCRLSPTSAAVTIIYAEYVSALPYDMAMSLVQDSPIWLAMITHAQLVTSCEDDAEIPAAAFVISRPDLCCVFLFVFMFGRPRGQVRSKVTRLGSPTFALRTVSDERQSDMVETLSMQYNPSIPAWCTRS